MQKSPSLPSIHAWIFEKSVKPSKYSYFFGEVKSTDHGAWDEHIWYPVCSSRFKGLHLDSDLAIVGAFR